MVGYAQVNGEQKQWIHTTSFDLKNNDLSSPIADGGKAGVKSNRDALRYFDDNPTDDPEETQRRFELRCSNIQRTFLNEETCVISNDACLPDSVENDVELSLDIPTLQRIHNVTGGATGTSTRYVYVTKNLNQDIDQDSVPPCTPGERSRWEKIDDTSCVDSVSYTHLTLPTTPYV